mgnify:CR=1 FL=1
MLSATDADFWNRLETLERRRRAAFAEHEMAMRDLYAAAANDKDGLARSIFNRYCETAGTLESALVELELFRRGGADQPEKGSPGITQ